MRPTGTDLAREGRQRRTVVVGLALIAAAGIATVAAAENRSHLDRSPARARVVEIADLMRANDFKGAQKQMEDLIRGRQVSRNGRRVWEEVVSALKDEESLAPKIEIWRARRNPPHVALLLNGMRRIDLAARSRGTGWGRDVSDQALEGFKAHLRAARVDLETALALRKDDAAAATQLIWIATGLGLSRPEMEKYFSAAVAADSLWVGAYEGKLNYLLPKWHGTVEDCEAFVVASEAQGDNRGRLYTIRLDWVSELATRSGMTEAFWRQHTVGLQLDEIQRRWLKDFPDSDEAYLRLGKARLARGEFDAAMLASRSALRIDPGRSVAQTLAGDVFAARKSHSEAEAAYHQALALDPENVDASGKLCSLLLYVRGDFQAALSCYLGLTRRPGAGAEHFIGLGQVFMKDGKRDAAIGAFSAAIERDQSYSASYRFRGQSRWPSDRDAAINDLIKADSLDPQGEGRGRGFIKEMESWERECEAHNGASCLRLAKRYEGGARAVRDWAIARTFYQRACEMGVADACSKVK